MPLIGRGGWFAVTRLVGDPWFARGAGDEVLNDSFFGTAEAGEISGTGDLTAGVAVIAGVGVSASLGSGAATASAAAVAGTGAVGAAAISGTGAVAAASATASGVGVSGSTGAGAPTATAAVVAGEGAVIDLVHLRPDADHVTDGWTDQAGGTANIVQSIDEASANDADYVQSPEVVGTAADLKVRLFDGTTQIVEWTHTDIADEFADAVQTLTAPQVAAISDFANLIVELDDNQGNVYQFGLGNPPGGVAQPVKVKYRYKKLAA